MLSSAELAAPAFVAAALATPDTQSFEIAGRTVAAGPGHRIGGELLAVIGDTRRTGIDAVLPQNGGDLVLGTKLIGTARNVARTSGILLALFVGLDARLAALILLSTLYFHIGGRDWLASPYLALTASTATNGRPEHAATRLPVRCAHPASMLSAGMDWCATAVILGGVRGKPRHHVVVCGLGRVGTAVAVRLQSRGVPVIAIERRGDAPGVLRARQLKIPVVVAAATNGSAQEIAGISRADAVLAVTDDEAVNLEIALVAKDANPSVRVVARVFDHDLASRVERRLQLGATRSVSMLAAPAFAAVALGRRQDVIFPVGRRVLLFTELTVSASSAAPGRSLRQLEEPGASRILAWSRSPGASWQWGYLDHDLAGNERIAVVATRAGLARLLRATRASATANHA